MALALNHLFISEVQNKVIIYPSLNAFFEIELGPLDFNMVSEPTFGCWADLPLLLSTYLMIMPHVKGHIK
jgi:hypothetical protein